ncbi:hypothetical protein LRS06_21740 [Hymenobacter sp. J193]|uniref:hypothetical protein n=1 Tax=Hymenobacter sp. J193 TaxID=2898429 RepID=UPI002150C294|nr:hypothetical protein [Hymenobacter sp. J193]MCR5890353.1 hypothetical protein [Hymenobacter sp. J193]
MSKEPRSSTYSVGQQVEVKHSGAKYHMRKGVIATKVGGGVYGVRMLECSRLVNLPTGGSRTDIDGEETKNLKLGSLQLIAGGLQKVNASGCGTQATLFS